MKARLTQIILGTICLGVALVPGWVAYALFKHAAAVKRPDEHGEAVATGWELYLFAPASALAALVLLAGGMLLIMSKPSR